MLKDIMIPSLLIPMASAIVMGIFAVFWQNKKKPEATIVACVAFVLFLIDLAYNFNHQ
jgi:hypothetical protein